MHCTRHTQFRGQLHHPELEQRREPKDRADLPQQAEPSPSIHSQARMASQLAYLYKRDHLLLPYKSIHLRK